MQMSFGLEWRHRRVGIVGLASLATCACLLFPLGTFPIYRRFEVVSINGHEIASDRPTFEIRWIVPWRIDPGHKGIWPIETWVGGSTGCNFWDGRIRSLGRAEDSTDRRMPNRA